MSRSFFAIRLTDPAFLIGRLVIFGKGILDAALLIQRRNLQVVIRKVDRTGVYFQKPVGAQI